MRQTDAHFRYHIPTEITPLVDTREQYPVLFPELIRVSHPELTFKEIPIKVVTKKKALEFGDYALEGYENICAIERKASQLEIYKNLNDSLDRIRQAKAFRKLASSCKFPYLLMEVSPVELLSDNPKIKSPEIVAHRLGLALAKYNLRLLLVPWKSRNAATRRKLGTLLLHVMLGAVLSETYDVPPLLLEEPNNDNDD